MTQLLFLPGLAGDAVMWQAQSGALADFGPRVTDVHTRFGTIAQMAAALLAENDGALVLCGASMGGIVAMEVARQAPQRLRGLALLGTNARPETPDMQALREAAIELFAQGRAAEVIEPNVALAFDPDNARNPALVRAYLDFVLAAGAQQLIAQNRAIIGRPDARSHLPQLCCPVLVMCGDADQLTPPECSREIAALIPAAELVVLPRCGHMLTMEKPEAVSAELRRWLQKLHF
ncbi:MAG: alpha/beta fold hydrolase [Ramlibacter sp.]